MSRRKVRQLRRTPIQSGELIVTLDKQDFVVDVKKEKASTPKLHKCIGPWHYKNGTGTMLPESEFDIATRGKNRGGLSGTCRDCRDKSHQSYRRNVKVETPNGVTESAPVYVGPELPTWRVTLMKLTEVLVNAKDYLDAGVAAGDGEVVKVERIK